MAYHLYSMYMYMHVYMYNVHVYAQWISLKNTRRITKSLGRGRSKCVGRSLGLGEDMNFEP